MAIYYYSNVVHLSVMYYSPVIIWH